MYFETFMEVTFALRREFSASILFRYSPYNTTPIIPAHFLSMYGGGELDQSTRLLGHINRMYPGAPSRRYHRYRTAFLTNTAEWASTNFFRCNSDTEKIR
ncbi:hypothetical protein M378DRAFT_163640 [Amanita muscaria Koide BX008]|uniref:Uncharacterized protein n=1 Tax=Amanita muscaria (strain Koide BX008) TaxID=946122 RepID=A0A0C2SLU7_AMAMK|nr:hypothetical protein M378DRAFT_163640 [Amanita muscaria Koide BX008]